MYTCIKGAVFFVDILGFGALTNHDVSIEKDMVDNFDELYHVNGLDPLSLTANQLIAAWTLQEFREILSCVGSLYPAVEIAQLSDCAFLWSEDYDSLIKATHLSMWKLLLSGILARGGLSSGNIIVHTEADHKLGKFVLGDAATRAVALERRGKGCRIFTDSDTVGIFHRSFQADRSIMLTNAHALNSIFSPITNPLDFSIVDEFKWYLYSDLMKLDSPVYKLDHYAEILSMGYLVCMLRGSPKFAWNCANKAGIIHVAASLDFISTEIAAHGADLEDSRYTADNLVQILPLMPRKPKIAETLFSSYAMNLLPRALSSDELTITSNRFQELLLHMDCDLFDVSTCGLS